MGKSVTTASISRPYNAEAVRFGPFEFLPERSTLLKGGKRVRVGSRALAILKLLCEQHGQFVSNDDLIAAAWPETVVEETNLRVQITALRRLLDGDAEGVSVIENAPGRGYAFVAELSWKERPLPKHQEGAGLELGNAPDHNIPLPLTGLIGRERDLALVEEKLASRRLVSVVGPGGIGKTRIAAEAALAIAERGMLRACFVDFSPLESGEYVTGAIAAALHLHEDENVPAEQRIIRSLRSRDTLLVLDNCEHVLDSAAALAEALLQAVPGLRILATSREPFRIAGEATVRLQGLARPEAAPADLAAALRFPAIELFVERAMDGSDGIAFRDSDAALLATICRRLDGIPLALELAAARIGSLGIRGMSDHVGALLALLTDGRRTSPARQRTLRATLDWSFEGLDDGERRLLARLSVFRASFSTEAVEAVSPFASGITLDLLSSLAAKSLVIVEHSEWSSQFRLLETTREFAEDKLRSSGEEDEVRRRHLAYLTETFTPGKSDVTGADYRAIPSSFRARIDDVRSAINWSFSDAGEARAGARLVIASAPMWVRLSLLSEFAAIIDVATERLSREADLNRKELMWLYAQLHSAYYNCVGLSPSVEARLLKALSLAEAEGEADCELFSLWGLFGTRMTQGRYDESLEYALRFATVARRVPDPAQASMGHRILALSYWRSGDFLAGKGHNEAAVSRLSPASQPSAENLLVYKQGAAGHGSMSNLLWLTGRPDAAVDQAELGVAAGQANDDMVGLCYALAHTIVPLAFWTGDLALARARTELLVRLARQGNFGLWLSWGRIYERILSILENGTENSAVVPELDGSALGGLFLQVVGTILDGLHGEDLLRDPRTGRAHWSTAELLRRRGCAEIRRGDAQSAERTLCEALSIAREQGTLSWELRTAVSLAELRFGDGRPQEAAGILLPVRRKFVEGERTADLKVASALLLRISAALGEPLLYER